MAKAATLDYLASLEWIGAQLLFRVHRRSLRTPRTRHRITLALRTMGPIPTRRHHRRQPARPAAPLWPPVRPDVSLDDTVGAVRTSAAAATLLTVFDEFDRPRACWVGVPRSVDEADLTLLEVTTRGRWMSTPRTFDRDGLTRLDFGGGYEQALHLVADPPPAA